MTNQTTQTRWTSNLNFILASAGSAIGLGNIWKFPYVAGENGGGAFVAVYLIAIALIGLPLLFGEIKLGQKTHGNVVHAFATQRGWSFVGGIASLSAFLMLTYYFVVGGWLLHFSFLFLKNLIKGAEISGAFVLLLDSKILQLGWHALFTLLVIFSSMQGFKKGIEKTNKILMPALFIMLIVIFVSSLFLEGSSQAFAFLLKPRFEDLTPASILEAVGHSFFTLSLAIGVMVTYGSYLHSDAKVSPSAFRIAALDTFVALTAGIVVFSVVFSFGGSPSSGPGLLFETLPSLFSKLPNTGNFWGFLFFLLISFAAFSSAISATEVNVRVLNDIADLPRKKSSICVVSGIYLFGVLIITTPMLEAPLGINISLFDRTDFLVSNILLPLTGLLTSLFLGFRFPLFANASISDGVLMFFCKTMLRFVCPLAILAIFAHSLF